jgi:two-component system, chemotaxis family, protein-glutamate methylesterase/glutaminase
MKKIRVVVIDDSAYNRRTITKMLESIENVQVVGYAADGEEGIRKIIDLKPDLVTLDLEMPRMDGFTLLRIIMNACPLPVIVISSRSEDERVFKALELGAVDFIAKPSGRISEELLKIAGGLQDKVRSVFNLNMENVLRRERFQAPEAAVKKKGAASPLPTGGALPMHVVAIGASTGGPPALQGIFSAFPGRLPFAVLVSQHMPAGFTKAFAERLNRSSQFDVREARDGDRVLPGTVLVAPGGCNLIFRQQDGEVLARLAKPSAQDRYIPSVDAMFTSLAEIYGAKLLAVVLTGMGNDGSKGVRAVKKGGGEVLAEAEETSVVFGMPREAIATGVVDKVVPLSLIAREITLRCGIVSDT